MRFSEIRNQDSTSPKKFLMKISPTFRKALKYHDLEEADAMGVTVAFVSVFLGNVEVANVGPFDVNGAIEMQREIQQDIKRSYVNNHPKGFTDGSGTIYRLSDWDINVETCHSSEYSDIVGSRMKAIRDR